MDETPRAHDPEQARGERILAELEYDEWARRELEAMIEALPRSRWMGDLDDGEYPLDVVLGTRAGVRVLRVLWGELQLCWPARIARRAGLSRTSVHTALARLLDCRMVEQFAAWDSTRTFAYRLNRQNPLVQQLERLFTLEASIYGGCNKCAAALPGGGRYRGGTTSGRPRAVMSASMASISRGAPSDMRP